MCKTIRVCSPLEIRSAVAAVLSEISKCQPVSEQCKYDIRLMISELLANSLSYSCREQAWLLFSCKGGKLRCCVMDDGCGFEHGKLTCPDTGSEHGRGRFLVAATADRLRYNRRGNVVLFEYCRKDG